MLWPPRLKYMSSLDLCKIFGSFEAIWSAYSKKCPSILDLHVENERSG